MDRKSKEIHIEGDYITLGQLLKFARIIQNGGEAKSYLQTHTPKVNGEPEQRRGRKLRVGDEIDFDGFLVRLV